MIHALKHQQCILYDIKFTDMIFPKIEPGVDQRTPARQRFHLITTDHVKYKEII